ncbi:N-acetylglucosaminyl deacetylase, LmbE family [Paenibacillus sp. yr247]|uniref:PIG-L deacetylase family protein n=1 Tax=Paenibacillus sp. yr247 TaxID=1761880 RepID=UPI000884FD48|nr:PIG-L deacetylase family protein [Paenibacillus sp. yr247]SDN18987.1 N-acetylglucosaminyl deacetylase, LmbE family [Paenibacillus sp. yr247]
MDIKRILGLPDLLDVKKIVCVQPHPDDNEVGAAGTLYKLAQRGCEIVYITVTDGRGSGSTGATDPAEIVEIRRKERLAAGGIIGVSKHFTLDFPDMGDYTEQDILHKLIPIIRGEKPDMLLTVDPWMPYEAHPDHYKTGKAVAAAMLFSSNEILFPTSEPFAVPQIAFYATSHPNTYVDVTADWERKIASILAHKSQFDNLNWPMVKTYFDYEAGQLYGKLKQNHEAAGYAEAFKVLTSHQLHFFPAALYS